MAGVGAPPASPGVGAGGAAQGGPPNFVQSTQDTLKGIYQNIAKANPNIQPAALFEAAQMQIAQMHGIEPDTKMYMQAQIAEQKIDMEAKMSAMKAQSAAEVAQIKADSAAQVAELRGKLAEALQGMKGQTAEKVAGISAGARLGAARVGADARLGAAGIGASSREKVQGMRDETTLAVTDKKGAQGAASDQGKNQARIRAATIAAGKPDPGPGSGGQDKNALLQQARDAIKQGAPRDAVVKKLRDMGVTANP